MNHYVEQAAEQIKADLRANTRFEPEAITDIQGSSRQSTGSLSICIDTSFSYSNKCGKGYLPSGVESINYSNIDREKERLLNRARNEVREGLVDWLEKNKGADDLPAAKTLWQPYRIGYEQTCIKCLGGGKVDCIICDGRGVSGYGKDKNRCGYCFGTGKESCSSCQGKGRNHEIYILKLSIYETFNPSFDPQLAEEAKEGLRKMNLETLLVYVCAFWESDSLANGAVVRSYHLQYRVTILSLKVAETPFDFYAYGEQVRVLYFDNYVSTLLEKDLKRYSQAIREGGPALLERQDELLQATSDFLQSKVHQDLSNASHVASNRITAGYATEARSVLNKALNRLYVHDMFFYWLGSLLLWLLLVLVFYTQQDALRWSLRESYVLSIMLTLLPLLIAEMLITRRLNKKIEALGAVPMRMQQKIGMLGTPWLIRAVLVIIMIAGVIALSEGIT